jgi:thymidylate synthase (FAD)
MNVKLISYSTATDEFAAEGIEDLQDLIAFCAKVSNPTAQINNETSERLLNYLVKHQHWSPFEMVSACLEIETTRDIAHQIVRHRSFSFQEFSQRYADPAEMGDQFVVREMRMQDTTNRQNSIDPDLNMAIYSDLDREWHAKQRGIIAAAKATYNWAIKNGIAKEQARVVLPEGLTKTRLYMNGTIRSWIHYIDLRGSNGTQKEHMMIAQACAEVITKVFPNIQNYTA